jgi:large subunit ribosomal protein L23
MATNPRDLLIRPVITEKTSVMMQDNKYTFKVPLTANKTDKR